MEEDSRREGNGVSYVELDGFRYYPDTFYLNELGGAEGSNPNRHGHDVVQLFSCIRLANSLADQLVACIFSTYCLNVPSFNKFYAPVVQRGTPMLILHGDAIIHRDYKVRTEGEQVQFDTYNVYQELSPKANPQGTPPRYGRSKATHWKVDQPGNVQIQQCLPRQPDTTDGTPVRGLGTHHGKYCLLFTRDSLYVVIQTMNMHDSHTVDGSWVQRFPVRKEMLRKGGLLRQLDGAASEGAEPLPLPSLETSTTSSSSSSSSCSSSSSSSSSTASSTQPPQLSKSPSSSLPPAFPKHERSRLLPNSRGDFGVVLTDYLRHETLSVLHKASKDPNGAYMELNTPTAFLQRHFGTDDFDALFDFSSAAVDLVTTVPCLYQPSGPLPLRYGLERIRELLLERKGDLPQTDWDGTPLEQGKLRMQQTSIMSYPDWPVQLAYMQRCMFAEDPFPRGRTEIIWPSWKYFKTCILAPHRIDIVGAEEIQWDTKYTGGLWFLDPEALERLMREVEDPEFPNHWRTFGLHPHCCPIRITNFRERYEKTSPSHWTNVQPHIKTYARGLIAKSDHAGLERGLSWLLLTSACVSKGAQGGYEEIKEGAFNSNREQSMRVAVASAKAPRNRRQVVIRYRNFEMGVLFHSSKSRGVLYSHWDAHRPRSPPPKTRVITLPVPYSINAPTYAQRTEHGHPRSPYTNHLRQLKTFALTRKFVKDIEHVFDTHKREISAHRAKQRARAEADGNATSDDEEGAFTALVVGHHPTARTACRPSHPQAVPHATHSRSPRDAVQIVSHTAKKAKTQESTTLVDLTSTSTSMLLDLTDEEEAVGTCVTVAEKRLAAAAAAPRVTSGARQGEVEVVWIE